MIQGTVVSYRVFVRNWWRWDYNGGTKPFAKIPDPRARKTTIARGCTEDEARAICERYAATHEPGPLSRKAEYESE